MPLAAAVKVTELPAVTVWLVGWVVKTGALVPALTVRTARSEVVDPAEFATTA